MKNSMTNPLYFVVVMVLSSMLDPALAASGEAKFIGQFVPGHMETGAKYEVIVQFKNTGRANWSTARGYRLHAMRNSNFWGHDAVPLPEGLDVKPGKTATLKFEITAPDKAGSYDFQWQIRNHGQPVAGDTSPPLSIEVTPAQDKRQAEFVMQSVPGLVTEGPNFSIMKIGQVFPVKILFKNTGTVIWPASRLRLVAQMPEKNLTWMIDSVEPASNHDVAPGEFATFEFTANAPTVPGIYDFQWRLYEPTGGSFGAATVPVKITVK